MPVMTNFFANFRKKSKQPKVETNEAMGEDVKAAPPAYISGSNTMSQPAATVPTPGEHAISHFEITNCMIIWLYQKSYQKS